MCSALPCVLQPSSCAVPAEDSKLSEVPGDVDGETSVHIAPKFVRDDRRAQGDDIALETNDDIEEDPRALTDTTIACSCTCGCYRWCARDCTCCCKRGSDQGRHVTLPGEAELGEEERGERNGRRLAASERERNGRRLAASERERNGRRLAASERERNGRRLAANERERNARRLAASERNARRLAANARERRRMRAMNAAFEKLRSVVPRGHGKRALSRKDTLEVALLYIRALRQALG